ncbi:DUF2268 domain-containing putative Zn-dependent protease [Geminicoccus harenae]|uniref:DUF2268 domain-containing putative Zn-dependent protease n=1 Tax=Geminicoccus harenae TaxID=2498453 RepID=UPI00168A7700|nr:DUF2268 domain-containing putative Zn-dependent protease [Geminicoccus harenae]
MQEWELHWLEAEGNLQSWKDLIISGVETARDTVSRIIPPPRLDILVQPQPGRVIPEIGMVGFAHRKSLFSLSIDPENPNLSRCLTDGTLARQVAHEVHHCVRIAGPGYGRTLGEALVSEGLAGRFVRELFGNSPEPWECAVDVETLRKNLPDEAELSSTNYDHAAWFFGASGKRPRWLGYTLGYELVGNWLRKSPPAEASVWIDVPAQVVLGVGLEGLRAS